ncbi:MAG: DUF58 domain-containing protein [Chloroflexota bacterium]
MIKVTGQSPKKRSGTVINPEPEDNAKHNSSVKFRLNYLLPAAVLLAFSLTFGSVLIWRLLFLWITMLLLAYLWTDFGTRGLEATAKKLPDQLQVGDWFDEEITVHNRSRIPKLLLEVRENSNLPNHAGTIVLNLHPRDSFCWQTGYLCRKRGRYNLGSLTVRASDPFSLFASHCQLGNSQSITIYPQTLELPFHLPAPRSELPYTSSRWLMQEAPPSVARIREYAPSDSLNHIHWRSTAHTGRLMVKVFETDRLSLTTRSGYNPRYSYVPELDYLPERLWLLADMHRAANPGDSDQSIEECTVTITASLGKKYLDRRTPVGLIAAGERTYLISPQTGKEHMKHMLEDLAMIKAAGETPVQQLIASETGRFGANSAVIVITPSVSRQIISPLMRLTEQGVIPVVVLIDPSGSSSTGNTANTITALLSHGIEVYVVNRQEETGDTTVNHIFPFRMKNARVGV